VQVTHPLASSNRRLRGETRGLAKDTAMLSIGRAATVMGMMAQIALITQRHEGGARIRRARPATRPLFRGLAGDIARRAAHGGDLFVGSRPFHDDDLSMCLGPVAGKVAKEHDPEQP
jgi:hypothetical protein